jgi:SpoVK/Ycf46/Vps4 family AAA+-type ATPase
MNDARKTKARPRRPTAKKRGEQLALSPSQKSAFDSLVAALRFAQLNVIWGESGFGKTIILNEVRRARFPRAPLISTMDFLAAMSDRDPLALEETYAELLRRALSKSDVVFVDDLHLLSGLTCCHHFYPRKDYFEGPLTAVVTEALAKHKTMILACASTAPGPFHRRCYYHGVKQLTAQDYAHITTRYLPSAVSAKLDFAKVHRFAPKLNGHQLRGAAEELALEPALDTTRFIDYVRSRRMTSNVDLAEVQAVDLHSLKGIDDVIESLEANVVLPFENDKLATELKIKPKRGVLLIGPPGTGKTTVGRALAHRLKSKFFVIDGTFISGTRAFYEKIQQVTEAAKQNAPSIIFIDDSDVIFEQGREQGLYRYLLTMLDGVESDTSGRVCIMMTAMDVGHLPPALIRSGRIELWLETRMPDENARTDILRDLLAELPEQIPQPDLSRLAAGTEGLTGADLKRLVEDGKVLFAFDKAKGKALRPSTDYFLSATRSVLENKRRYAEAEAKVRATPQMPNPFAGYDYMSEPAETPA